jgi:hypothetical protein
MDKVVPLTSRTGDAGSNMKVVNCDRGEEIARALARAEPGSSPSHRTRPPSPGMASMWSFFSGPAPRSMALTLALLV